MRKTKLKNGSFWQAGTLPFVALWAASYAAACIAVILLFDALPNVNNLTSIQANVIGISTQLLVTGLLHVQVVERLLRRSMRGWMIYTLMGNIITLLIFNSDRGGAMGSTTLSVMSLLLPVTLFQTVWLWKRVRAAWLWPLASLVSCLVFAMVMRGNTGSSILVWAALLHGLVQGGVMRHLWMQTASADTEKPKVDFNSSEDEVRSERLKENEAAFLASISDDRSTQKRQVW